ncbi:MAG: HAMP domain-containing protein, partial [Acetatifactor sp.]|nr:HAMP domain-containing protein [Acetatifactor sp.]
MRLKKSIFTKLIGCFVLYVVVMIVTFVVCLLLEVWLIAEGDPTSLYPYGIIDEDGNVAGMEILQKIGGWVEELEDGETGGDGSYHVARVYGEKKTGEESYSLQELLELTAPFEETEYIGFFIQPENSPKKYLCFYDRSLMQISVTMNLNNIGEYEIPDIFPLFFPISILEILLISLYLKRKIKRPLDQIMAGMEDLRSGNSGARIDIKTEAEFEKIVDTFNLMAQQLEDEKAQRETLIRKKNQMLLELSHDIRTPIATIKSYANALESGLVPKERIGSVYHTIDSKADRVEKLSD